MNRILFTCLLLVAAVALPCCTTGQSNENNFARSARLTSQGANDPQERLRDELGEFMVYFERTITRLKNNAIREADGNEEQLYLTRTTVDLIERMFTKAYSRPNPYTALVELWYDAYRLNAWRWEYEKRDLLLLRSTGITNILNRYYFNSFTIRCNGPEINKYILPIFK